MRVRALAVLGVGAALAVIPATASAQLPSTTDPRANLAQGLENAGVAQRGMELLAHLNKAPGWFDPANPGSFAFAQSDIAFQGNYAFFGSFNGFTILDITNPSAPSIKINSGPEKPGPNFSVMICSALAWVLFSGVGWISEVRMSSTGTATTPSATTAARSVSQRRRVTRAAQRE